MTDADDRRHQAWNAQIEACIHRDVRMGDDGVLHCQRCPARWLLMLFPRLHLPRYVPLEESDD